MDEQVDASKSLSGRVAVVTGGGRGIGAAVGERLVAAGASVFLVSRSKDEVQARARALAGRAGKAFAYAADATDAEALARLFDEVTRSEGAPSVVVHSAGVGLHGPFGAVSAEQFRTCMEGNVTSAFLVAREAFRTMASNGGDLVFVSSLAGLKVVPGAAVYGAAKAAVLGLARSLAEEGAPLGIRVNSVCPGAVETAMRRALFGPEPAHALLRPEAVADAVLTLLGPRSAFVRGAELVLRPAPGR